MPSGRLAGISVRPLRRQSTMLLLQLQLAGHTATCGTHVLDSVWAGPVDGDKQYQSLGIMKQALAFEERRLIENLFPLLVLMMQFFVFHLRFSSVTLVSASPGRFNVL